MIGSGLHHGYDGILTAVTRRAGVQVSLLCDRCGTDVTGQGISVPDCAVAGMRLCCCPRCARIEAEAVLSSQTRSERERIESLIVIEIVKSLLH